MLYQLLYPLHEYISALNVFRYITFRAAYATVTALLISFLVSHRLFVPRPASAGVFAAGIGIGVFAWFGLVIELLSAVSDRAGAWVKRSTALAGVLLILFGVYFTIRSISGILGS